MTVDVPFVKYSRNKDNSTKKQMDNIADEWEEKRREKGSVLSRIQSMVDDFNKVNINDKK